MKWITSIVGVLLLVALFGRIGLPSSSDLIGHAIFFAILVGGSLVLLGTVWLVMRLGRRPARRPATDAKPLTISAAPQVSAVATAAETMLVVPDPAPASHERGCSPTGSGRREADARVQFGKDILLDASAATAPVFQVDLANAVAGSLGTDGRRLKN